MKILVINSSYVNFVGTLFSIALDKYFDEVKCFNLPNKIYYDFDILEGKIETYYNKYNIEEKDLFNYDFDVILALQTSGLYTAIPIYNTMKKIGKKCLIGMQILDYPQHVFQHNKDYIKDVYDSWQFYLFVLKEFKFDFLLYNMYNAKDALSSYTILTKVQNFIKYPVLSHITELPQEDFIVYSGRIVPDKGVQYIIEALSLLNKPIKFIMILIY